MSRRMLGLKELNYDPNTVLFDAERLAFRNGFEAGEREAEKNVIEDDAAPAHRYNYVQNKQQKLLDEEIKMNLDERAALQRTASLEAEEHSKLAAWSARVKAEAKLLAKAQHLKEEESKNLKKTAGLESNYARTLRSRAQELRAKAANKRLARLAARHQVKENTNLIKYCCA